jgi:hypothetical protein
LEFVKALPILDKVIVGLTVCATNLYHTSYATAPAQSAVMAGAELVAPYTLPVVVVQLVLDVNVIAPAQALFAGAGSVMQTVKVPFEPEVE